MESVRNEKEADSRPSINESHSNLIFVPLTKKQRIDDEAVQPPSDYILHANDFIKLVFVDIICKQEKNELKSDAFEYKYYNAKPTFTHQLFEEEKISFLSEATYKAFVDFRKHNLEEIKEIGLEPGLLIYIKCNNLTHYVTTKSIAVLRDKEMLMARIQTALPTSSHYQDCSESTFELPLEHMPQTVSSTLLPPGKLLSFSCAPISLDSRERLQPLFPSSFDIFLASHKDIGATEILERAEKIAMWYIETADSVDFADERWEVLNLYNTTNYHQSSVDSAIDDLEDSSRETCLQKSFSFAGYMTLFTFHNPFLGSKIRVCQALVLPHMQGKGLGRLLLLAVYNLARSRASIAEVTVEDPAPAFERLRDSTDCEWVLMRLYEQHSEEFDLDDRLVQVLDVMDLKAAITKSSTATPAEEKNRCKDLKLTPSQTFFAYEALHFAVLVVPLLDVEKTTLESSGRSEAEEKGGEVSACVLSSLTSSAEHKAFRLRVKRRLLSANKHLKGQPSHVMQKELEQLFQDLSERYIQCLASVRRIRINISAQS